MKDPKRGIHAVRESWLRALGASGVDADLFHASTLEVIERPASPVKVAMAALICGLITVLLVASCVAHVDIIAKAPGRVDVMGRSKVVQPFDQARILRVLVTNGSHVKKGDVVAELDPTQATADRTEARNRSDAFEAELERRQAAVVLASAGTYTVKAVLSPAPNVSRVAAAREQAVLRADLAELDSSIAVLESKITESQEHIVALEKVIEAEQPLLMKLRERVTMRADLARDKWESLANVLDAQETLDRELTTITDREGQIRQERATIASLRRQQREAMTKFMDDNAQAAASIAAKAEEARQEVVKTTDVVARAQLTAPVDGIVQELAITTPGQVVVPGQQLMTIVPEHAPVEVEALVSNGDIGFISVGQPAVVKVETFPFVIYGTLSGKVTRIARDAVDGRDLSEALPSGDAAVRPVQANRSAASPTPAVSNLVFPVTIAVDNPFIDIGGQLVRLSPGMAAEVDIRTGTRRVSDFVLAPLREVSSQAMRER